MRNALDFSSWQGLASTLLGLALFSLVVVGIRLLVMHTVQLRRERENRQINERLRTLIAAYKVLGGSFTGNLAVDPTHLRDASAPGAGRDADDAANASPFEAVPGAREPTADGHAGSERRRRIRDAVEAALSDVILLGTEEQVRLAARAASDMVAGRAVETAQLVVSLRNFIRDVLDLEAVATDVVVPRQGPARPAAGAGRSAREERAPGASGARGGAGQGGGAGMGALGLGAGSHRGEDDANASPHS